MPYVPNAALNPGPDGPHLALYTNDGWVGIPEGATLWLVEDKANPLKIFPLVLTKVHHTKLAFGMQDGNGGVTEYVYKLTTGKPKNKQAVERMLKNRK